jgi:hypothetical protein
LKEAEANKLKLTPQFLELKFIEAIADNTKIFFGDKVLISLSLTPYARTWLPALTTDKFNMTFF